VAKMKDSWISGSKLLVSRALTGHGGRKTPESFLRRTKSFP
jgi:hypothetical protein